MSDTDPRGASPKAVELLAQWYDGFAASAHFGRIPEAHRGRAWVVIEFFGTYAADYTSEMPGQWTAGGVCECCVEILPRKVTDGSAFFEAVAPVLAEFFRYLDEQQLQPGGGALAAMVATLLGNSRCFFESGPKLVLVCGLLGNWIFRGLGREGVVES